jgi:hypothetical protein
VAAWQAVLLSTAPLRAAACTPGDGGGESQEGRREIERGAGGRPIEGGGRERPPAVVVRPWGIWILEDERRQGTRESQKKLAAAVGRGE